VIDAIPRRAKALSPPLRSAVLAALVVSASLLVAAAFPVSAYAGKASSGDLLFYPCTDCHPVTLGSNGKPTRALPNDFERHEIELTSHDLLGKGSAACVVCHDDPAKNPGMLKLVDGSLVDIKGDVSKVCYQCHSAKYKDWQAGTHGKHEQKCTSAGCHDPHTPSWIYIPPLMPFTGSGFQVRAVSDREPFTPLASPPPNAPVETPSWLVLINTIGVLASLGIGGALILGRPKQ